MHTRILLPILFLIALLAACNPGGGGDTPPVTDVARLELDITPTTIEVGGDATVTVTGYDENENAYDDVNVEWSSSDASVARVVDGTFEARKPGNATITATAGEGTDSVDVTVIAATNLASVTWEPSEPISMRLIQGFTILADDTFIAQTSSHGQGTFTSQDGGDTWTRVGDGFACSSATEDSGLIAHPSNADVVLRYCDLEMFRSSDGGQTWSEASVEAGVSTTGVNMPHPAYNGRPFHTWYSDDVVRYSTLASADGGSTWHGIDYEYPIVHDDFPTHWFASHEGKLYESTNAGDDWSEIPTTVEASQVGGTLDCAATIDPKAATASVAGAGSELYLVATQDCLDGTYRNLTLKSIDGGSTWSLVSQNTVVAGDRFPTGARLTANPNDATNLHLTSTSSDPTVSTLHVTTDGGATWNDVTHPGVGRTLHYPPGDSDIAILVSYYDANDTRNDEGGNAFISYDQGVTWDSSASGFLCGGGWYYKGRHFITTPENPNVIYFGQCVSTDGGSTWAESETRLGDVIDGTYAYSTWTYDGITRSEHTAPGIEPTIFADQRGLGYSYGQKLFADLEDPTRLLSIVDEEFYGASGHGTLVTENPTSSEWTDLGEAFAVAQAPSRPSRWYLSTPLTFAVSSDDLATTVEDPDQPGDGPATKLVVSHQNHDLVYLANDDGVFKSTDAGGTWAGVNDGFGTTTRVLDLAIHPADDQILYAATPNGIYRTSDGGGAWTLTSSDLDLAYDVTDLEFNVDGSTIMAVAYRDGVYRRHGPDGEWERADNGLPSAQVHDLDTAPNHPNIAYAATEQGVWRTGNRGSNWHAIGEDLPYAPTLDLALGDDGHRIYALTQDSSVTALIDLASGVGTDIFVGVLTD